jgi:hypothetical protein
VIVQSNDGSFGFGRRGRIVVDVAQDDVRCVVDDGVAGGLQHRLQALLAHRVVGAQQDA